MTAYLDILEFVGLLLRAASFSALTLCAGGALFLVFVSGNSTMNANSRIRCWTLRSSLLMAAIELLRVTHQQLRSLRNNRHSIEIISAS